MKTLLSTSKYRVTYSNDAMSISDEIITTSEVFAIAMFTIKFKALNILDKDCTVELLNEEEVLMAEDSNGKLYIK